MIDNIRFNFIFNPDENWFPELKKKMILREEWSNKKSKAFIGKLFLNEEVKTSENKKTKPSLLVEILFIDNKKVKIIIKNSLRKWFFNNGVIGDFNKSEFEECLNLISIKLNITPEILLNAKVTRVEYGANLGLRDEYRCFYTCIYEHYDLKKKCTYGNETIEFKGENRSVIFYDKVTEQKGKSFSAKNQKKINDVKLLLRYEIKVTKMSGSPEKPLMSYIKDILKNWNEIANLWYKELDKITFIDDMSPNVYDYLKDAKIKPIKDYLIYLGIKKIGLEECRLILSDRIYSKIRKSTLDSLMELHEDFNSKVQEEDFEKLFKEKVREKAKKLQA